MEKKDVLTELVNDTNTKYIYGAGCIALDAWDVIKKRGIDIEGFCVDDNYYKESKYYDKPVVKLSELLKKGKNISIICGMENYWLGEQLKKSYSIVYEVYYLINVTLQGETIGFKSFYDNHISEIEVQKSYLKDEYSRRCFDAWIDAQITEDMKGIFECYEGKQGYFRNSVYELKRNSTFLDIGAFNGDTIRQFNEYTNGNFKKAWACEFEQEAFTSLLETIENLNIGDKVVAIDACLWKEKGKKIPVTFHEDESQNSHVLNLDDACSNAYVISDTIDALFLNNDDEIDLIKVNYRGQLDTLYGGIRTIHTKKPRVCMMVGADPLAILESLKFWNQFSDEYDVYMRFHAALPERLALYAIPI